jgi:ribonucleoside-diphosphate reductase alpha chain
VFVEERFSLNPFMKRNLRGRTPSFGFGQLGSVVYYRTYSRLKDDGSQETWADTVIRVVEGVMSIRKDWYVKHKLPWDESYWQAKSIDMADAIYEMRFLPPGRGLWAMGTPYIYERGGMALQNCGYVEVNQLSRDAAWAMDALMCGVGVGFGVTELSEFFRPPEDDPEPYVIPDSREGWVESLRRLIASYEKPQRYRATFDYSQIRPAGEPIRGFGGTASGPDPLIKLHERVRGYLESSHSSTRVIADVMNAIGACVVAGNVRRSAEIALGSPHDSEFVNLKNYELYPDRADIGWMSNNSIVLANTDDFKKLPDIAEMIRANGEPGIMNLLNIQKYGRYGDEMFDSATGCNPCAEQPLEDKEVCCLVEVFPTKCQTDEEYFEALELAQIYAHTVSLLPTHSEETNAVVARNHRIGESLSGIADWFDTVGASPIVTLMRQGYDWVREINAKLARDAGVAPSIRVTTVKPSGTVSQLAGVSPGMHYPPYTRYVRRIRVGKDTPIGGILASAGVPHEDDAYSDNTTVFEFPVEARARRSQRDISMHQKGWMVATLQRHWSDNMVSNTVTFNPKTEGHQIEDFLAFAVPFIKTLSLLPDTDEGAYAQMPYEGITKAEYDRRAKDIATIDWSTFGGSDGQDSKFCNNDSCEVL